MADKPAYPYLSNNEGKTVRIVPRDHDLVKIQETIVIDGNKSSIENVRTVLESYLGDKVFADRFVRCIELIRKKNADYTQGVEKRDRIAAFRRIGGDIDVPMRKVWAIFAQKHWGAVMKYVKDGVVESEPIGGRIDDLINYFVLLGAILDDEKELADMAKYGA